MDIGIELVWSAPVTDFDGTRDTADPLGFRGWATQLARDLVPGLTQVTFRTRGYALLCKGLLLAQSVADRKQADPVEAFLRFERLWVGAQRAVHGEHARWAGVRMASVLLSEDSYRLDKALTSQQLYSGLWGAYRRSSTALGLIQPIGHRSGPAAYKLTTLGSELASAVTKAAFVEKVRLADHILKESLQVDVLKSLIAQEPPGDRPSAREVEILSTAMMVADEAQDNALLRLRRSYDQRNRRRLALDALVQAEELSAVQHRAATAARDLCELMVAIEEPYRRWVTGSPVDPIPPAIWRHVGWETVHRWPVPELVSLHALMRSLPEGMAAFEAIQQHHARLMEQRGAEPWERDIETPTRSAYQAPDFCLPSASQLFSEGVLQGAHS